MSEIKEKDQSDGEEDVLEECDVGVRIKQTYEPLIKHKNEKILHDGSNFISITGHSGCGKTFLLGTIIPAFDCSLIIVCTQIRGNKTNNTIKKYCDQKGIKFIICYTVPEAFKAVQEAVDDEEDTGHKVLIMDDFTEYSPSRSNPFNVFAQSTFCQLRNYNFSMIFITQSYVVIPPIVRVNLSQRFIYPMSSDGAVMSLKKDLYQIFSKGIRPVFDEYYDKLKNERYTFIVARTLPKPALYHGFDEQINETYNGDPDIVSGDVKRLRTMRGVVRRPNQMNNTEGFKARYALLNTAKTMGIPFYLSSRLNNPMLTSLIDEVEVTDDEDERSDIYEKYTDKVGDFSCFTQRQCELKLTKSIHVYCHSKTHESGRNLFNIMSHMVGHKLIDPRKLQNRLIALGIDKDFQLVAEE